MCQDLGVPKWMWDMRVESISSRISHPWVSRGPIQWEPAKKDRIGHSSRYWEVPDKEAAYKWKDLRWEGGFASGVEDGTLLHFILENNGRRASWVLVVFCSLYAALLYLALDDFVARTVLTGDWATTPLGRGLRNEECHLLSRFTCTLGRELQMWDLRTMDVCWDFFKSSH